VEKLTQAQLRQVVADAEPLLRRIWARRTSDQDIIVLGDLRRPGCRRFARDWWDEAFIDAVAGEQALPFLPYIQTPKLIRRMLARRGPQREAALELRGFAARGLVPLWVVASDGHWAIGWAPPRSNAALMRPAPEPAPKNDETPPTRPGHRQHPPLVSAPRCSAPRLCRLPPTATCPGNFAAC
jgi:hypothetical protein